VSMHTTIDPSHTSVDLGDGPIDLLVDGAVRVPTLYDLISKQDHATIPVLAGQTAAFSFTEAQIRTVAGGPALIQASLTVPEAAAGAIFGIIVGKVTDGTGASRVARVAAYIGAYATIAQCIGDITKPFTEGHWADALIGARKCLSDNASTVTALTARSLADLFPHTSESELAGISAKLGKALKALGFITVGLDATEWLNDHRLVRAGFQVHVFAHLKAQRLVRCGEQTASNPTGEQTAPNPKGGIDQPGGGYSAIIMHLRAGAVTCATALQIAGAATFGGLPAGWTCTASFPNTRCRNAGAAVIFAPGGDAG